MMTISKTEVRPEDAVHQQLDLLLRLEQPIFRQAVVGTLGPGWRESLGTIALEHIPEMLQQHVRAAETYHVSADMVTLIEHAADKLSDDDQYSTRLPPTPAGFVVLDRPFSVLDVWGNEMLVHAVAWGPMHVISVRNPGDSARYRELGVIERDMLDRDGNKVSEATMFVMFNDIDRRPDFYSTRILSEIGARRYRERFGHLSLIGAELLKEDIKIGPRLTDPRSLPKRFQDDIKLRSDQWNVGGVAGPQPFTNSFRLMVAMFELMNQTVTTTECRRASKTTGRRAAREGMESTDVTVVTLRRRGIADPDRVMETHDVRWGHRWVVDGHWHRYRVGPGRQEVRRMWVDSYVKGPDDKPLVVKKKIYDLRR